MALEVLCLITLVRDFLFKLTDRIYAYYGFQLNILWYFWPEYVAQSLYALLVFVDSFFFLFVYFVLFKFVLILFYFIVPL